FLGRGPREIKLLGVVAWRKISFYRVYWTDGNDKRNSTVREKSANITNLTPGVQYNITVRAVEPPQTLAAWFHCKVSTDHLTILDD
uniref:Fibronectin type-III domain-containing protein n=1 Tax=Kryptolebias marmoratus TaxID=37003 RepID=A0A3Q2ZD81_KRYMA